MEFEYFPFFRDYSTDSIQPKWMPENKADFHWRSLWPLSLQRIMAFELWFWKNRFIFRIAHLITHNIHVQCFRFCFKCKKNSTFFMISVIHVLKIINKWFKLPVFSVYWRTNDVFISLIESLWTNYYSQLNADIDIFDDFTVCFNFLIAERW